MLFPAVLFTDAERIRWTERLFIANRLYITAMSGQPKNFNNTMITGRLIKVFVLEFRAVNMIPLARNETTERSRRK